MDDYCVVDCQIENTRVTDTDAIIDIRLVNIFDFYVSTLSKHFKKQIDCDLPRSICTINKARVHSYEEFIELVENKSFSQNMLIFCTQTVMAAALCLLHQKYPQEVITDSRNSLETMYTCDNNIWQVISSKSMYLNKSKRYIKMNVMFESQCDYVIVTFEKLFRGHQHT